jgi:acetylornithine deacetylase/succinyl-diaminopimelate desuccinylase-like protein
MLRIGIAVISLWLSAGVAWAQQDAANVGARLLQDAAVKAAVEGLRAAEPQTLEDQVRLCEVEAPPFKETQRAQLYAKLFKEIGLTNVRIDKEGNVLGEKRGTQPRPHLVFSAHLDTVFPEGTPVAVKREGHGHAGTGHRR